MAGGIPAGKTNRILEFHRLVLTQDETGQETRSYAFDFRMYGAVSFVRGREQMKAEREEMAIMLMIARVRFNSKIAATHRIKFNGIFWDIQSMAAMGRMNREVIEITAEQLDINKIVEDG